MTRTYATSGGSSGGGGVAGNDKDIQFNSSGVMAGNDNLVFDYTNQRLGVNTSSPIARIETNSTSGTSDADGIQISIRSGSDTRNIDIPPLTFRAYIEPLGTYWGGSQIQSYYTGNGGGHGLSFRNTWGAGPDNIFTEYMKLDDVGQLVLLNQQAGVISFLCPSLHLTGVFVDGSNSSGTSGQILKSTGTSVQWTAPGLQTPISGAINGVNQTYAWTTSPNVIVVDNGNTMQKVSSDGTVNWTGTNTTLLTVPPNRDIFAIA